MGNAMNTSNLGDFWNEAREVLAAIALLRLLIIISWALFRLPNS
jgi:hypothetical protein